MTSQQLCQIQEKYRVLGMNNTNGSAQLQWPWLIELCYMIGCHANSIHAQDFVLHLYLGQAAVMSFSRNITAILLYVL